MFATHPWRVLLSGALLLFSGAACAARDEDPENGQSWLLALTQHEAREGQLIAGTIRATDDYGATGDRDFRLHVSGDPGSENRKLVLNRFDSACFELAPAARLTLEDYCDQITLTYRDGDAEVAFSSLDANRRYAFTLRPDPQSPGDWSSLTPSGVEAPTLHLSSAAGSFGAAYRWQIETLKASHSQAGEITTEQMRDLDLSALEASLMGLGEVLATFNRYTFQFADLPRDHPSYEPTPYALWAEEVVEGGCIFAFCFGNLGGGGGGASNNNNVCSPQSPSYDPSLCPHDLTYARWPLALRPKIIKINDSWVRSIHFVKNVGTGTFKADPSVNDDLSFLSLVRVGDSVPLVDYAQSQNGPPYGPHCHRTESASFIGELFVYGVEIEPGKTKTAGMQVMSCSINSGRPPGRYRLYIDIDPSKTLDTPGYQGNNIGQTGTFEWVNLRE